MTIAGIHQPPIPCLLAALLFFNGPFAFAESSIWYRDDDPLKTEAITPPHIPSGYLDDQGSPCAQPETSQLLTLAEVANTALCNNPQTREAWASARAQAAFVGIAKSAYLPIVTDNISADLNWNSPELASRTTPDTRAGKRLAAAYLLYA